MGRRTLFATFFGYVAALSLWVVLSIQSPLPVGGFAIITPQDGSIVVKDGDIVSYNAISHELILTGECVERIRGMKGYLEGSFAITVDGEEVLSGIFVPPIISRSYPSSQVVIIYPTFDSNYSVMRMQMGYPWDGLVSQDPRDDPRIAQYFEATGRLVN